MNSMGIPVFYGALDIDTCISEIRSSVGGNAAVGQFEIIRQLKVLDLTVFNEGFLELDDNSFIISYHKDISKPILPRDEALEYIPTQVVSEYLSDIHPQSFDGIIYSSAQKDGEGNNIVLFNKIIRDGLENTLRYIEGSLKIFEITSVAYDYREITHS